MRQFNLKLLEHINFRPFQKFFAIDYCSTKSMLSLQNRIMIKPALSYDVAVFQWITSCNKSVMTTRVLTLLREYVTSLTTSVTTMLIFIGNVTTLKAMKSYLRSHMIKRI